MTVKQTAGVYFILQSIAVGAWWLLLVFVPASRRYFEFGENSETALLAFWLPDLSLVCAGSLVAGLSCLFDSKLAAIFLWFVCGALSYAAFYCLALAAATERGWLGVALMLPATLWSGVFAVALPPASDFMFRQSRNGRTGWIVAKTAIQIVIVWSLILVVFPFFIVKLEDKLGVPHFGFPFQQTLAALFFIFISTLGMSAAFTMSRIGRGTPLPLDAATRLVVKGAYAFVRNPMAISGVGQGLAVALWLGSPLVFGYALMGALIWQLIFRRLEEIDLQRRFGTDYENYRSAVRCWLPRLKPYKVQ